jgi:phosphohistidine phosphatase SixA
MRFLLFLILSGFQFSAKAQPVSFGNKARIYLVRHAEKGSGDDPLLTDKGNKRAGDLVRILKNKKIGRIYVTEYRRTQNTGDSLRIQLGIDTVHYLSDTSCTDLLNQIRKHNDVNKAILIIGHSNTIPLAINKFGLRNYPKNSIPENEFDNLFLLTFKNGQPSLEKTKYGSSPGTAVKN